MPHIYKRNCDTCGKYYEKQNRMFCSRECRPQPFNFLYNNKRFGGRKHTKESIIKKHFCQVGSKGSNWQGGINPINKAVRKCYKYREWMKKCMERDNYTCQKCGIRGGELNVDHEKPFSSIIRENNIKNIKDAINCEELWDINNGKTLCNTPCHRDTPTYGGKIRSNKILLKV